MSISHRAIRYQVAGFVKDPLASLKVAGRCMEVKPLESGTFQGAVVEVEAVYVN
jgi:hypothetical protein